MNANFESWRRCYERTYGIPLEYDTIVTEKTDPLIKKYAKPITKIVPQKTDGLKPAAK